MSLLVFAQDAMGEAERGPQQDPIWWFWLGISLAFLLVIGWLLRRAGPGGAARR